MPRVRNRPRLRTLNPYDGHEQFQIKERGIHLFPPVHQSFPFLISLPDFFEKKYQRQNQRARKQEHY